jgi:hypothetical protein
MGADRPRAGTLAGPWAAALIVGGVLLAVGVALASTAVAEWARDVTAALTHHPIGDAPL